MGVVYNPDRTNGLWNRGGLTDIAIQNFLDKKATYAGSTVHFLSPMNLILDQFLLVVLKKFYQTIMLKVFIKD